MAAPDERNTQNYHPPEIVEIDTFTNVTCGEGRGAFVDFYTWWF